VLKKLPIIAVICFFLCVAVTAKSIPINISGNHWHAGISGAIAFKTEPPAAKKDKDDTLKFYQFRKKMLRDERRRVIRIIKDYTDTSVTALRQLTAALKTQHKSDSITIMAFIHGIEQKLDALKVAPVTPTVPDVPEKEKPDALTQKLLALLEKKTDANIEALQDAARIKRLRRIKNLLESDREQQDTTIRLSDTLAQVIRIKLNRKADLFGYHFGSNRSKAGNYNFKVLGTLAYYAYQLNGSTGNYTSINGWDTSTVIDEALNKNCKVVLVVSDKNPKSIDAILKNPAAQRKLGNNLVDLLALRKAHGVNIMFEAMGNVKAAQFTKFIAGLRKTLKSPDNKTNYELSVTIPARNMSQA
jgi:hypothetical protein